MTLTITIEESLASAMATQTAATGESPATFVEDAIRRKLSQQHRDAALDAALERIRLSGGSLGRDGRSWHEISHEGHRW